MFNQFLKSIDIVISDARSSEHVLQKDYFPIYDVIERYVVDNKLLLSNAELLADKKKTTLRNYIIYGDDIFRHSNNLSNELSKITIHVLMYTNKKNEDFTISVNRSPIVQLFSIRKRVRTVIAPVLMRGMFIFPPELELIDIYHKLYSPQYAELWEGLLPLESNIREQFYNRQQIVGGFKKKKKSKKKSNGNKKPYTDNKIIFDWLRGRSDYILIGVNAINILTNNKWYFQKVQILSNSPIKTITDEFSNLIFQHTGIRSTSKTHNSHISTEPRLTKTVISITIPAHGKRNRYTMHLLDIFNAPHYELVPYITYNKFNIGCNHVLRAFLLINLWFSQILFALNVCDGNVLKYLVCSVFENFKAVDDIIEQPKFSWLYMGTHVDLATFKKKESFNNVYYPYAPEQHRYRTGAYRQLSKK